jgi:hypothetical protein
MLILVEFEKSISKTNELKEEASIKFKNQEYDEVADF